MGSNHDACERCGEGAYYDPHKDWCYALSLLEERIEELEARVEIAVPSNPDEAPFYCERSLTCPHRLPHRHIGPNDIVPI